MQDGVMVGDFIICLLAFFNIFYFIFYCYHLKKEEGSRKGSKRGVQKGGSMFCLHPLLTPI